jgi:hypothetical protein
VNKTWILKRALVVVGTCLALAWAGATYAAERQTTSDLAESSAEEDLRLLKSDAESVIVELSTPDFQVEESVVNGTVYHLVDVPGCGQTDEVGKPQLPVRGALLGIPASADYSLRVVDVDEETVPGQYNVYPAPKPVMEQDEEGNPTSMSYQFARDDTVYASSAFFPEDVAVVGSSAFVRDQRVVQLRFFPFQYNPVSGELRHYSRIRVEVAFSYPDGQTRLSAPRAERDSFEQVFQSALLNYDSARQWRARSSVASRSAPTLLGQGEPRYKVLVDEDGIYQLTYADLQDAGMELGDVHTDDFELYNQGRGVAIYVSDEDEDGQFDEEDYILFYGQAMTTTYTSTNVYWLDTGAGDGLRMPEKDGTLGASTVLTYFNTSIRWEEDTYYRYDLPVPAAIPSDEEMDHWFGGFARNPPNPAAPQTMDVVMQLPQLAVTSPSYSATLRGGLTGEDNEDATGPYEHSTKVYLNGDPVHEGLWLGQGAYEFEETDIPHTDLEHGENTVTVECLLSNPAVAPIDVLYVNWLEIDYRRTYTAENDLLFFDGDEAGTWRYEVPGFLTNTIEVFDVSDPFSVTHFVSTSVELSGTYAVEFQDSIAGEHHYLALVPSQYQTPLVVEDNPSNLSSTSNGADYIIITHADFEDAVLPLRDHRAADFRVEVIDVQDIYDEFSYGVFDPRAIRDFLKYAYENWVPPAPSYVLLVGDGNYDFKDHSGRGEPNYVPPYLLYADQWYGETAADNRYVCVSGDDELPDMYIGRFPALTAAQVTTMVSKTVDYETTLPEGSWRQEVFFLADEPDNPGDPTSPNHFWSLADDVADHHVPPAPLYNVEKVYYDYGTPPTTIDEVESAINDAFEEGRLFFNYVGHASVGVWGGYPHPSFLSRDDVAGLPPSDKTPIVMAMACLEGKFINPSPAGGDKYACLAERLLRAQGKGSVANWSPTSEGLSNRQHYLHVGFYDAVFRDNVDELGPATNLGKLNLFQNTGSGERELIDTYVLLGDPALQMPVEQTYMAFLPLGLKVY